MAQTLPVNFPLPAESAIASYDWTDIADSTGIRRFYVSTFNETTGYPNYGLVSAVYKSAGYTYFRTESLDLSPFTKPCKIGGTAVVGGYIATSSGNGTFTAQFFHVLGATETAISSAITGYALATGSYHLIRVPITDTVFQIGSILRLKMIPVGTNCDIQSDTSQATKTFIVDVPFRIQL